MPCKMQIIGLTCIYKVKFDIRYHSVEEVQEVYCIDTTQIHKVDINQETFQAVITYETEVIK